MGGLVSSILISLVTLLVSLWVLGKVGLIRPVVGAGR